MKNYITSLIGLNNSNNIFSFNSNTINPVEELKKSTINVPNTSGLYFVFVKGVFYKDLNHLIFSFNDNEYSLMYFGKAGGLTKKGKIIKQGLKGRINNVISKSKKGFKDLKRANYWELVMKENNITNFIIRYVEVNEPRNVESDIYNFLKIGKLDYPYLNCKLGRPKKTLEKANNQKISLVENNKSSKKDLESKNVLSNLSIEKQIVKEFSKAKDIHQYFRKLNFEDGTWNHVIYETENPNKILCSYWESTTIPNKYFGNPDTSKNRMIDNKQPARWKIIEKEMIENNIESVSVKFFTIKNK